MTDYIVPVRYRVTGETGAEVAEKIRSFHESAGVLPFATILNPVKVTPEEDDTLEALEESEEDTPEFSYEDRCVLDACIFALSSLRGTYFGAVPPAAKEHIAGVVVEFLTGEKAVHPEPDAEPSIPGEPGDADGDEGDERDGDVAGGGEEGQQGG